MPQPRRMLASRICQTDTGVCFDNLEYEVSTGDVYATFHDGSEYRYHGLTEEEARRWAGMQNPGCYFNMRLWPGQYTRIKGPA